MLGNSGNRRVHEPAIVRPTVPPATQPPPDYGMDAPAVIRNLLVIGGTSLVAFGTAALDLWSGALAFEITGARVILPLASMGLCTGLGCVAMAL